MRRLQEISNNPIIYGILQRVLSPVGRDNNFLLLRNLMNLEDGETVLDVGCGVGSSSRFFPYHSYTGVDPGEAYLSYAKQKYGNRFIKGDACELPFADESFNYVFSANVFHHLSDEYVYMALQEMKRICKHGGKVFIEDTVWPANWLGRIIFSLDLGEHQRSTETLSELLKLHAFELRVAKVPQTFPQKYSIFEYSKI